MKKSILLSLAAFVAVCLASCGGSSKSAEAPAEQLEGISVDEVMANPDSLVGDTIVIEGVVSHLCRQGGRKAFVAGNGDNVMLRLQNIAAENGEESAERAAHAESGCDTERAAQGQAELTTFNERMADYRAKIADSVAKGGNPYLSYYYLDAVSYEILPE